MPNWYGIVYYLTAEKVIKLSGFNAEFLKNIGVTKLDPKERVNIESYKDHAKQQIVVSRFMDVDPATKGALKGCRTAR